MTIECSCDISLDVGGQANFTKTTYPTARKEHICYECCKVIIVGEKYENCFGVWEGEANTYKTCLTCLDIRKIFFSEGWYYGEILNYLEEYINESQADLSSDCILSLSDSARDVVFEMIENYWKETEDEY